MWNWSKLSSTKWMDAWEERFYSNPNSVISEIKGGKSIRVELYLKTKEEAEEVQKQFGGSIREVKEKNWDGMNQKKRAEIKIRKELIVTDDLEQQEMLIEKYPSRHILVFPAEMAFGTGDHATTSNCLRFLVDVSKKYKEKSWDMLDLGCGTAILAIAASKLGAASCLAYDFDARAVKVSQKNIQINEVPNVEVCEQDVLKWKPEHQWDVVMANLFSTILQEAFPIIKQAVKDEGQLIVSGILAEQWEETKLSAEEEGFVFDEVVQKGKWVSALGRKKG